MKIAKDRLKEIIKEELQNEMHGGDYEVDPDGYEGHMAKTNLYKIAEYAQEMHDLIHDDENLEPWVQEKIAVAAYMMDAVGHYLQYNASRGDESEGEEEWEQPSPAERHSGAESDDEEEFYITEETEFEEGDSLNEAEEAAESSAVVRIYDFDGVLGEFSPDLKQKFFEQSQQEGSKITGTEIQIKNTLALGASLLATAESVAKKYVEGVTKPTGTYYIISKFSNPSYVFKLAYYDELREFLEKNGLDLREAPNAASSKKVTIIKKFLERTGAETPAQILVAENTKESSKLTKAEAIPSKHKSEKPTYMIIGSSTADGKKESSMIKTGLTISGVEEDKIKITLLSNE